MSHCRSSSPRRAAATSMPMVELVIKQAEALSLYNRAAHNRKPEAGG